MRPSQAHSAALSLRSLCERFGPHPVRALRLQPLFANDIHLWLWFVASSIGSRRTPRAVVEKTVTTLRDSGRAQPAALAGESPQALAEVLHRCGAHRPEEAAPRLLRAARTLMERADGSLSTLARGAEDLDDLARRLLKLAPGIGPRSILRFLRPLRDAWPTAREVPLSEDARAAAVHLGFLRAHEDLEGEPAALRALWLREENALNGSDEEAALDFADVEAALEQLGAAACRREQPERCLLREACPLRSRAQ